jgi:hypothetical protein
MIAVNELRINNWYYLPNSMDGGRLHPSQFLAFSDYLDFEYYGEPIPLSPEILEKIGFRIERIETIEYKLLLMDDLVTKTVHYEIGDEFGPDYMEVTMTTNNLDEICVFNTKYRANLKYLHQLQNLIFSLTGKEIEVKF